jgi:GNAT superfamily N-acetyltransferase
VLEHYEQQSDDQAVAESEVIREYDSADAATVRQCVVALQESERVHDPRLPPGEEMADAYCEQIHARCRASDGRVFVAEQDGDVVGFVAVLAREAFTEPDDPPGAYALVSDLVVLPAHRGRGLGRRLLQRAEAHAREAGATELRVVVLAANETARRLYLSAAFQPHLETFSKRW